MNWKAMTPLLAPVFGTMLTALMPSIQHALGTFFSHLSAANSIEAGILATLVCAAYHALPSFLQK